MIKIQLWRSFSCNNSSSYYLVARFKRADAAEASAAEVSEFLAAHGEQSDAMWEEGRDPIAEPTDAAKALATKHGFEWTGYLAWGDEGLTDWLPDVHVVGNEVMLYHNYCGGFGEAIPAYFKAVGAEVNEESRDNPQVAILFSAGEDDKARAARDAMWSYAQGLIDMAELEEGWVFSSSEPPPPFEPSLLEDMEFECGTPYPAFNDGDTIGLILEISRPQEWDSLPAFFATAGITDYRFEIDRPGNIERFRAIAAAACPECESKPLKFLEAGTHETPGDQLACRSCGGMFALASFIPAAS